MSRTLATLVAATLASSGATAQTSLFELARRTTPFVPDVESSRLVDLDGDGVLDLFRVTYDEFRALAGDGHGAFRTTLWTRPRTGSTDFDWELFDADGDGDLDLVVARRSDDDQNPLLPTLLFLNDGTGAFVDASGQLPASSGDAHTAVVVGDVDADGDLDLLLAGDSFFDTPGAVWANDGTGTFVATAQTFAGTRFREAVAVDLDGDQAVELVYAPQFGGVAVLANDGTGVFTEAPGAIVGQEPATYTVLELGPFDADGDGDADLVVSAYANAATSGFDYRAIHRVFLNDGVGVLTSAGAPLASLAQQQWMASGHVLGDFDGDGDVDVVVSGRADNELYANDGTGAFSFVAQVEGLPEYAGADAGDVDGDGDEDLVVHGETYLAGAGGLFAYVGEGIDRAAFALPGPPLAADVDGDGDQDVVLVPTYAGINTGNRTAAVLVNDGAGRFASQEGLAPLDQYFWLNDLAAADLNGDGADDLVGAYGNSTAPGRYFLSGAAAPAEGLLAGPLGGQALAAVTGDVDGDGDVDVVLGMVGGPARLYRNDGAANFTYEFGAIPSEFPEPATLLLADLDGDGDLDLHDGVLGLENVGGSFVDSGWTTPSFGSPFLGAVAAGDVDGDGVVDLVLSAAMYPVPVGGPRLYLGDGAGNFVDGSALLGTFDRNADRLDLLDLDLDGDLDAVWSSRDFVTVTENRGVLGFVELALPGLEGVGADGLAATDFDGDEDADLFLVSETGLPSGEPRFVHLAVNRTVQVNAADAPRIGRPLRMDLAGAPGAPWLLAWSPNVTAVTLPALGTLYLDPAQLYVAALGALDVNGGADYVTTLPANVGLLGRTFYAQAAIGAPARLSNLETLPIRDL